ncbi:hypothetical protein LPJ56_000135 [Coemansia sp. RSA 2599]|nr:hypothetical protein LPJ75_000057 [Coemansia sp. RSA 2598]KAJ1829616.1 hypothetical protein LPJ56_000135 [Coemansia sp. RSA 2599]
MAGRAIFAALAHIQTSIVLYLFLQCASAREPLVSLTVSILSNLTSEASRNSFQATFDRSDYTYPLPQTGLSAFGFAGELYVPEDATCADEVIDKGVRQFEKPEHSNGIAFLPYRSCRSQWEWILHQETRAGRASGAVLYSMKDNAAQAAERAVIDLTYLHTPVWVVNAVTGQYLIRVMEQVYANQSNLGLPAPPNSVEYQHLQDDVRLAVRSATEGTRIQAPRVFVTISRSAADVASADRNFFLKAMIGVGITGIVCFFIAMLVRYFDCLKLHRRRSRRSHEGPWTRNASVGAELDRRDLVADASVGSRWMAGRQRAAQRIRQLQHGPGRSPSREKRVLRQHELDAMPCKVISAYDLKPTSAASGGYSSAKPAVSVPAASYYGRSPRASASCPHLLCAIPGFSIASMDGGAGHRENGLRVYSFHNASSVQDLGKKGVASVTSADGGLELRAGVKETADGGWDSVDQLECAICLDEIHIGDVIRILPCPHLFHSECIDRWLLYQSSFCPLCKRDTLFDPSVAKPLAQLDADAE